MQVVRGPKKTLRHRQLSHRLRCRKPFYIQSFKGRTRPQEVSKEFPGRPFLLRLEATLDMHSQMAAILARQALCCRSVRNLGN